MSTHADCPGTIEEAELLEDGTWVWRERPATPEEARVLRALAKARSAWAAADALEGAV